MKILLTNDDGINARGIYELYHSLKDIHEVTVVAPISQKSGAGHSITLNEPLRINKFYKDGVFFGYAINGTPADCIKIGLSEVLKENRPDLIISGINKGANLGTDVIYSGTVSGAVEGTMSGISSLAVSTCATEKPLYSSACQFLRSFIPIVRERKLPDYVTLNINVPNLPYDLIKGIKITYQSYRQFEDRFIERRDPFNRKYYWLTGDIKNVNQNDSTDALAIEGGYISITPLFLNLTHVKYISELEKWSIKK
ncbi:5'/3'-nucleotidase SurE [candidate division WOR-3 bacterium]|nr:5'/3'-nucleotidase SurE [candidate division WOR-3 bacterium]